MEKGKEEGRGVARGGKRVQRGLEVLIVFRFFRLVKEGAVPSPPRVTSLARPLASHKSKVVLGLARVGLANLSDFTVCRPRISRHPARRPGKLSMGGRVGEARLQGEARGTAVPPSPI